MAGCGRGAMTDDLHDRGSQDRVRINVKERHEVAYWCAKFGVARQALLEAVKKVGPIARDVEALLKR